MAAVFSDTYAAAGMKIVLSGTDSLGFWFALDEELYDRARMIHTTVIPYAEFRRVLGIRDIDEYIRFGGLMKVGETAFDDEDARREDASFRDDESTRRRFAHCRGNSIRSRPRRRSSWSSRAVSSTWSSTGPSVGASSSTRSSIRPGPTIVRRGICGTERRSRRWRPVTGRWSRERCSIAARPLRPKTALSGRTSRSIWARLGARSRSDGFVFGNVQVATADLIYYEAK